MCKKDFEDYKVSSFGLSVKSSICKNCRGELKT